MTTVSLPQELEQFAAAAVAAGRYQDLSHVLAAGLRLLQRAVAARAAFNASLEEAEAEGEREGFLTIEEVHREISDLIGKTDRTRV
jgi:putative addiction module CopG family antidote